MVSVHLVLVHRDDCTHVAGKWQSKNIQLWWSCRHCGEATMYAKSIKLV